MPTPAATVEDYCALLVKSRLLLPEHVEQLYRKFCQQSASSSDVDAFRRFLVKQQLLTEYQAHMIQRGRAEGFFIGNYKILERVGKGQMGGVYKAIHPLGQMVALKILPASKAADPHILARFQREAKLLLQLDHPNVVRAFQIGEEGGVHYFVMEYLDGESLQEVLDRRKRLPWPEAVRLFHQVLQGLQHIHEKRMVHRDIKPSNLLLVPAATPDNDTTWNATVKILDIGLGRELFDETAAAGEIETQLTAEGTVLGTPDYLAPEQARDASNVDIRADIYSVGCVLYQCLTGQPPFPDTNILSQMVRHAMESPRPVREFVADVPPLLQTVLDTMLAKKPEDRYATPAAAAEVLSPLLTARGAAPQSSTIVPAYKAWLESESAIPAVAGAAPAAPPMSPAVPSAALPAAAAVAAANVPAPPSPLTPASSASPGRQPPSAARARAMSSRASGDIPAPPARPTPPPEPVVEVEVELVDLGTLLPAPAAASPNRPLTDLSRRDWLMVSLGGVSVLAAVGLGYAIARLLRPSHEATPPPEENQPKDQQP